ncbi:MAG: hypothetical protein RR979_04855 [Mucinivorans sp.]
MKTLPSFLLASAAALALFSCQKQDDQISPPEVGDPINVNLRISGQSSSSRRVEDPAVAGDVSTLNSGLVFFLNKYDEVVGVRELALPNAALATTGQTFTGIKPAASKVYVVGNFMSVQPAIVTNLRAAVNLAAIKALLPFTENQQLGHKNTILANVLDATPPYVALDGAIKGTASPYTAQVLLGPIMSRIQVSDIQCVDPLVTSFIFKGIYIDNYYPNFSIATDRPGSGTLINIAQTTTGLTSITKLFEEASVSIVSNQKVVSASQMRSGVASSVWAYQVPSTVAANAVPRIIVQLTNFIVDPSVTLPSPQFLTVTGFVDQNGVPITKFEAGKVYSIAPGAFTFRIKDLYPTPNPLNVDVIVKVTVKPWTLVSVLPQL